MLSSFSVKRPHLIIVVILVVLLLGGIAYANTTVDFLPNMNLPYIVVATVCPGLTPEEVESQITVPVESAVRQLDSVDAVTSTSAEHYSLLIIELDGTADLDTAVFELEASLNLIKQDLPDGTLDSVILQLNPSMLPVMEVSVSEEGKTIAESSEYLKTVQEKLQSADGVSTVSSTGLIDNMLLVMMSEEKLSAFISGAVMPDMADFYYERTDEYGNPVFGEDTQVIMDFDQEGYDKAVENSEKLGDDLSALINSKLTNDLLATAIYAQNLELPAGSIKYGGGSLVLKIGEEIGSLEEFRETPIITIDFASAFAKYGAALDLLKGVSVSEATLDALIAAADESGVYKTALSGIIADLNDPATSAMLEEISPGIYRLKPEVLTELSIYGASFEAVNNLTFPVSQLDDLDAMINGVSDFITTSGLFELITEDEGGLPLAEPYYQVKESLVGSGNFINDLVTKLQAKVFTESDIESSISYLEDLKDLGDVYVALGTAVKNYVSVSPYFSTVYETDGLGNIVYETVGGEEVPVVDHYEIDNSLIDHIRAMDAATLELQDMADIIELNTAGVAHNLVNGEAGVIISISKQPDYSTVEVTDAVLAALGECAEENADFDYLVLSNQGESANSMLDSILLNILLGAVFVILILFLGYLRDKLFGHFGSGLFDFIFQHYRRGDAFAVDGISRHGIAVGKRNAYFLRIAALLGLVVKRVDNYIHGLVVSVDRRQFGLIDLDRHRQIIAFRGREKFPVHKARARYAAREKHESDNCNNPFFI